MLLCGAAWQPVLAQQAQPESNTVIGPNEIRDFSLPGSRPAPEREPEPTTAPVTPPRAEPRPQEPVAIPAPAAPTAQPRTEPTAPAAQPRTAPAERAPAEPAGTRNATPAERGTQRDQDERERLPSPDGVREALDDTPLAAAPATGDATPLPAPAPVTSEEPAVAPADEEGSSWLFPLLGALALLGGAVAFLKLRQRRREQGSEEQLLPAAPEPEPEPLPIPAPAPRAEPKPQPVQSQQPEPAPVAAPAGHVGLVMRPWLELEFRPARATATDGGASVQYEAVIRNTGNAPARNVRLAARMFNAGPELDAEVARFFGLDISAPDGAPLTILPRSEVSLSSVVSMPREEMREIKVQGRSLFIPTVAFNLLYEWGRDKIGQTCSSHVVGREAETPTEKMGPFRLDLGPRIYRSVGQRPSALAKAV